MKLYEIKYGNGLNGSKTNIGSYYVIANNIQEAKLKLNAQLKIKLGNMSAAKRVHAIY